MSDKHLTEASWKALVQKSQIKDTLLQKALATYSRLNAAKDPASALETLDEISAQATRLKKANAAQKEVSSYLEEVLKEANKMRAGLASLAKPQEPRAASGDEAAAEADDMDQRGRLISALKRVKAGEGQESLGFLACVAKPCYGVLFARNSHEKLGAAHRNELAKLYKATRFIQGQCIFEENAHTFVVETVSAGLAKNLKKALKEHTGLAYRIRVRDLAGKAVTDADTELDPPEDAPAAPPLPGTTPAPAAPTLPGGQEMARFTARFKALQPQILQAIAGKTPQGEEIKQHAVEAGARANKKDFAGAHQLLDLLESLLKKTSSASAPAAPAPESATHSAFQKAWAAATDHLLEAVDRIQDQLAVFAAALMQSREENLVWIAEEGLSQVLTSLRDSALAIHRANSKLPARVVFQARPAIEALKRQITAPRVLACDQNQLGVQVAIRDTISNAIQDLEAALELARA